MDDNKSKILEILDKVEKGEMKEIVSIPRLLRGFLDNIDDHLKSDKVKEEEVEALKELYSNMIFSVNYTLEIYSTVLLRTDLIDNMSARELVKKLFEKE